MKYYSKLSGLFLLLFFFIVSSCSKDDIEEIDVIEKEVSHTVIVYILGNNNLHNAALENINEMETIWREHYKGNLVVVFEPKSRTKEFYMMKIEEDYNPLIIESPVVKEYYDMDAMDPEDMKSVLSDVVSLYPSDRYSLILWSHGTGWLPPYVYPKSFEITSLPEENIYSTDVVQEVSPNDISPRAFGESDYLIMDIHDLCDAIPSNVFDNIFFDACFMGSIEVLYEMRDKADYFIASPTEILSYGFPYHSVIPIMFSDTIDLTAIGESYMNFYKSLDGELQSATIGVIASLQLEGLAQQTKSLIQNTRQDIKQADFSNVQYYDGFQHKIYYDLKDAMSAITPDINLFSKYNLQFEKAITYSGHTDYFMSEFKINRCSGISCFLPIDEYNKPLNNYYKSFSWYKDSGFDILFDSLNNE